MVVTRLPEKNANGALPSQRRREAWGGESSVKRDADMVFLDLLLSRCCRRCLHREDFEFEAEVDANASKGHQESSHTPSRYFLLGFKDRNLEQEFLEDLVGSTIRTRVLVGYCASTALFLFIPFMQSLVVYDSIRWFADQPEEYLGKFYSEHTPRYPSENLSSP